MDIYQFVTIGTLMTTAFIYVVCEYIDACRYNDK